MLIRYPRTVMVNNENYYREYKGHTEMAKFDKLSFWHGTSSAHAHYMRIVCAKYQKASVKALVQLDFLMYALSKHMHNPYLIGTNG